MSQVTVLVYVNTVREIKRVQEKALWVGSQCACSSLVPVREVSGNASVQVTLPSVAAFWEGVERQQISPFRRDSATVALDQRYRDDRSLSKARWFETKFRSCTTCTRDALLMTVYVWRSLAPSVMETIEYQYTHSGRQKIQCNPAPGQENPRKTMSSSGSSLILAQSAPLPNVSDLPCMHLQ